MPGSSQGAAVMLREVAKIYGRGAGAVTALAGVSLEFPRGSFTAVMGPSGSGKSTLLQCAGGLDVPDRGEVWLGDIEIGRLSEAARTRLRRERIGFIFQAFNLLPALSAEQNIELPLRLARRRVPRGELREALDAVGMGDRAGHLPSELSGGQQQRVAVARALIHRPDVLFADEPTGALDAANARHLLGLMQRLCRDAGQTVVMVTHDPAAASGADRVVFLAHGKVAAEAPGHEAATVAAELDPPPALGLPA